MRLTVERDDLVDILSAAMTAHSRHMSLPILQAIRIEADTSGLRAACTDLRQWAERSAPADVAETGSLCVSPAFYDYVRMLPDGPVALSIENSKLVVEQGRDRARFATMPVEDYPDPPEIGGNLVPLDRQGFCEALGRVLICAAPDRERPILSSCLIELAEGSLTLVAADGFRLGKIELWQEGPIVDGQAVIPAKNLRSLLSAAAKSDTAGIDMTLGEGERRQVQFCCGPFRLVSQVVDGVFPDYRQIIPADFMATVSFSRDEMRQAVRRCAILARDGNDMIRLHQEDQALRVMGRSEIGDSNARIEAEIEGGEANVHIAFNSRYLLDMLDAMPEQVTMHWRGASQSALFTAPGDTYQHVIMPMYVADDD